MSFINEQVASLRPTVSFTVGHLAKLTGLTVRALHHYDAIGLLAPSLRSESGYRLYTQADIVKLYRIQSLQHFGLSLTEIESVLARDGATLPELIAQQLATLDEQTERTNSLRSQLQHLQEHFTRGDEPATGEWLAAVELITQYDKYFSPDELKRLIAHNNDDLVDWRQLMTDLHQATKTRLAPDSIQAKKLLERWSNLLLRKVGGDVHLAIKMKLAYANDAGMQARMEVQGGATPQMMAYLSEVVRHTHRALWSKHLQADELRSLQFDGNWQSNLLPAIGALMQVIAVDSNSIELTAALNQWHQLLNDFVNGDADLQSKVEIALDSDGELQKLWFLRSELIHALRRWRVELANAAMTRQSAKAAQDGNLTMFDFSKRIVYSVNGMAEVIVTRDVVYKTDQDTTLLMDVYAPPQLAVDARLPVVFFVHGGPIPVTMMSPKEWGIFKSYGELAAASGFVGITFNHRLFSQTDYDRSKFDVQSAVDYVRTHATQLHVDPDRIALWIFSGGGPHLSWALREPPRGLRCAIAFYAILDVRPFFPADVDANIVAALELLSAAAQVKEFGKYLPIFVARAGLDMPLINQGIDRFVSEALAGNATLEVMNHAQGQHTFDCLDDNSRSREIIAGAIEFLRTHLRSQ